MYNFNEFFERILEHVCEGIIKQNVVMVEWKHIFGMVFNDEGPLALKDELEIFHRVQKRIQVKCPLFSMKIIACGLKILGNGHIQSQLDACHEAPKYSDLVVGFDMVNEEDFTPPIDNFLDQIYESIAKAKSEGKEFPTYLHCGESNSRDNDQLYDAIILGTKRIGHGFHLAYYPELMKVVKEKDICIECCPISNFLLGYVLDLRCHPARGFLKEGIPVTISPDDPGFMYYEGVTLDYVYCYLAWELDMSDLKQLCQNTITYASASDEYKKKLQEFFNEKWDKFIEELL